VFDVANVGPGPILPGAFILNIAFIAIMKSYYGYLALMETTFHEAA